MGPDRSTLVRRGSFFVVLIAVAVDCIRAQDTSTRQDNRGIHENREITGVPRETSHLEAREAAFREADSALKEAVRKHDMPAQVRCALVRARVLQQLGGDQERNAQAKADLDFVRQHGEPAERFTASNNLAVLCLGEGDAAHALAILKEAGPPETTAPPATRALYSYNTGRAQEAVGDVSAAYRDYMDAVQINVSFLPALKAACNALWKMQDRSSAATKLARTLLVKKRPAEAALCVRVGLATAQRASDAEELVGVLIDCYVAGGVTAEQFTTLDGGPTKSRAWSSDSAIAIDSGNVSWSGLRGLPENLDVAHWAKLLEFVYLGSWSIDFRRPPNDLQRVAENKFSKSISSLLQMIADQCARRAGDTGASAGAPPRDQLLMALCRYATAWTLQKVDTDGLLYAAAILQKEAKVVDPNGKMLDELIAAVFHEKGLLYGHASNEEEWRSLMRFHALLGSIFTDKGQFGTDGTDDPSTAFFQLRMADNAAKHLRERDPQLTVPVIHKRLGECYDHSQDKEKAWDAYVRAAEGYAEQGKVRSADSVITRAEKISVRPSAELQKRLDSLKTRLTAKRPTPTTMKSNGP